MNQQDRRESTRAIAVSSRDDFRHYVHKVLDDIEEAESVGNMRSVTKLTRILAHKDRRTSCNPSKGADGRLITTTEQLLTGWEKFLGAKFQRPTADADRNLENLVAEEDVLSYDELECMFIHGRPSGSNGTTDIYNQTTCKRMLHKIVSLLENSQHSRHSRPWRFVDQCLPASQITCRLGVPSAPVSGQHEQACSPYRRTQNARHSSVQIKR